MPSAQNYNNAIISTGKKRGAFLLVPSLPQGLPLSPKCHYCGNYEF